MTRLSDYGTAHHSVMQITRLRDSESIREGKFRAENEARTHPFRQTDLAERARPLWPFLSLVVQKVPSLLQNPDMVPAESPLR